MRIGSHIKNGEPGYGVFGDDRVIDLGSRIGAGYTCLMDGSIRDYQARGVDHGKNFYHARSCGPWMMTMGEVPADADMRIRARLNGDVIEVDISGIATLTNPVTDE